MPGLESAECADHDERQAGGLGFSRNQNNSSSSRTADTSICIAGPPTERNSWGRSGRDRAQAGVHGQRALAFQPVRSFSKASIAAIDSQGRYLVVGDFAKCRK